MTNLVTLMNFVFEVNFIIIKFELWQNVNTIDKVKKKPPQMKKNKKHGLVTQKILNHNTFSINQLNIPLYNNDKSN